jgi:uncharacterized repeat protein (TIGR02543 family)
MFHSAHPCLHFLRLWLTVLALLVAWPAQAVSTFTDNNDGTVSESVTSLMWDKCTWGQTSSDFTCATGSASTHTWGAALGVAVTANAANYKGHNDWRLPNRLELESLVDINSVGAPTIEPAFPNTQSDSYWSSTLYPPTLAYVWYVDFSDGNTSAYDQTSLNYHVRLVRSGQSLATFDALAPAVSAISPSSGSPGGGTAVTISGSHFTGATAVTIDGIAVTGLTVVNDTTITATTPAGTAGAKEVAVTAPEGTGSGLFTYVVSTYALTASASPTAGGSASCTPNPVNSGSSSTCTATPASSYTFSAWSGDCSGATCVLSNVTSAKSVTASFTFVPISTYAIASTASPTVGGSASCTPNPVNSGSSSTCSATPASGYGFSAWSGDCSGATCVLSNVTSTKAVTATFTPNIDAINALSIAELAAKGNAFFYDILKNVNGSELSRLTLDRKNLFAFSLTEAQFLELNARIQGMYTNAERLVNMANLPLDQITTQSMVLLLGALNALSGTEIATLGSARLVALINTVTIDFSLVPDDKIVDILIHLPTGVIPQLHSAKVAGIFDALDDTHLRALPLTVKNNLIFTLNVVDFLARNDRIQGEYTNAERLVNMANLPLNQINTQSMVLLLGALNALSGAEIATLGSARLVELINTVNIDFSLVPDDKIVDILIHLPADVIPQLHSAVAARIVSALSAESLATLPESLRIELTKWTTNYTVSFISNGGSAVSSQSVIYNGTAPTPTAPTKTGSTFAGWYSDSGLTTAFSFATLITANTTLYAQWSVITYSVTPSPGANGSLNPPTVQTIGYGALASFTVTPATGYGVASATGCNGGLSGNTYTTGPIAANCQVDVTFSASRVDGACGSDNGQTLSTTPSQLCTTGTTSLVYGSGPWNWTCAGSNGGSTASCSATASSHAVTASVSGSGGTISPTSRTVAHNGITTFTVSPSSGYVISAITSNGCSGSLSGTLYTTGAVTVNCTVNATFTATNTTTVISTVSPSPSKVGQSVAIAYGVSNAGSGSDTVTVKDGNGNTLCTGTVSAGSCNTPFSSSGAKTLIAHYTPSGTAQASDSPGANHLVADSPALATPTLPSGVVGVPYATLLVASGGVSPYAFSASGLPAGFSLSSSGLLSGTASAVAAPTLRITVTDHLAQSAGQDYPLSLVAQLTVATTSLPEGLVNAPYDQTLQAVGGKTPYVWTVMSGTLPSGLTLNTATGQLNGQPANLGSSAAFTVQVQDADARTASQVLSLTTLQPTVVKTNGSTTLSGNLTPSGGGSTCTLDDSQTLVLNIGDNGAPTGAPSNTTLPYGLFKMTVQGCTPGQTQLNVKLVYPAALPPGTQYWKYGKTAATPSDHWYVLPSAVISGNTVNFSITDGGLGDDDLTADGSITDPGAAGSPLLAISGTPGSGQVGSSYSATLTPSNGSGPYNWSMASGGLPNGVVLNAGTGQLSGTPTQAGSFNFTVQLVDTFNSQNASTTRGFAITMANAAASYALTANASPSVGGSASCTPNLVTAGGTSTCTATPAAGYTFSAWSGDCTGATCVLSNVQAAMNVTALFTASNTPPSASAVSITGSAQVGQTLTGRYTYSDAEGDLEGGSTFQWYADSSPNGNTKVIRSGATANTTPVQSSDLGQVLFFCVTPQARSGTSPGSEACSAASAPISAAWIAAVMSSGAPPKGTVGSPYRFTVTASGTPLISFSASGLPPGLSLDAYSGLLSGTPSTAGSYSVTFSASNTPASGSAAKDVQVYTMMIEPAFAAEPASIPTLSEWGMILLSGLMALFGFGQMRRRHG